MYDCYLFLSLLFVHFKTVLINFLGTTCSSSLILLIYQLSALKLTQILRYDFEPLWEQFESQFKVIYVY